MSNSGKYKFDKVSGKVVKVSSRMPSLNKTPDWKKSGMNAQDEERRGYASLEAQGKLNQVDDKECWREHV